MPPRKKARAKRSKPQSDVELDVSDNNIVDLTAKAEELEALDGGGSTQEADAPAAATEDDGGEKEPDLGNAQTEIKQEDEELGTGSAGDEVGLGGDGEKDVVDTSEGLKVEEEEVEEEEEEDPMEDDSPEEIDNVADNAVEDDSVAVDKGVNRENENGSGSHAVGGSSQVDIHTEQNLCEEGTDADAQINNADTIENRDSALVHGRHIVASVGEESIGDDAEDDEDEALPSTLMNDLISDRRNEKQLEIFVGRLDKGAAEDDLTDVFKKFGEIKSVRIVRNQATNKSRGFGFVQYTTAEQAKNALSQLKDGIEVRGKMAKLSASQDNSTLFLGNICKLWTKDTVLETLKGYGVENIEELHVPDDPRGNGKIKGFAFLEFTTHSDAMAAFQLLRQPTAVFGRDISAKVSFAHTPVHPTEELASQVKTVCMEGLPNNWNEDKVKEVCKQHGEIETVKLSRKAGSKRKHGFVTFSERESALACVEGVNNTHIGGGEVKIVASMAKPRVQGRLQRQGFRGGFKVNKEPATLSIKEEGASAKETSSPNLKHDAKTKQAKKKGKMVSGQTESKPAVVGGSKVNKSQKDIKGQLVQGSSKMEPKGLKRKNQQSTDENRGKVRADNGKPSKKQRGTARGQQNRSSGKQKRDPHRGGSTYGSDHIRYATTREPAYVASSARYPSHIHSTLAGTKRPIADLAPHAGYIEPVNQQRRSYSGYPEPAVGLQSQYPARGGYLETSVNMQSQAPTGYREVSYGRPHSGYLEPATGTRGLPPVGYMEPTFLRQNQPHERYFESAAAASNIHRPYDLLLRRDGRQDAAGISHSAYVAGSSLPASYVPTYSSYTRYEGGSSAGGGLYQTSGGAPLTRRPYY